MNIIHILNLVLNRPFINTALEGLKRERVPYREREQEWRLIFAACSPRALHEISYRVVEILRNETEPIIEAVKDILFRLADERAGGYTEEYIRDLLKGFEILLRTGLAEENELGWLGMDVLQHDRRNPFEKLDVVGLAKLRATQLIHRSEARRNPRRRNVRFS